MEYFYRPCGPPGFAKRAGRSSLLQGLSSLGVIVTIFIYIHQRRAALKAEIKQRTAATEAETRREPLRPGPSSKQIGHT